MTVCIVSISNLRHSSMLSLFTDEFKKEGIEYDLVYVDKYNEHEQNNARKVYKYVSDRKKNPSLYKIKEILGLRRELKKASKENEYEYIVVWRTETSYILYDLLLKKYKNRYILNVRDYCKELEKKYYYLHKKLIDHSLFTTISSPGFKEFLPESNKYIFVNSISKEKEYNQNSNSNSEPIRINFIGNVRFYEEDKKVLNALKNDERFIVGFIGANSNILKEYCQTEGINNVYFHDKFLPDEENHFFEKTHIINNLYGHNDIALDTAISIRYYKSLQLEIPILVYKDTYMENMVNKSKNGFVFDGDFNNFGDKLFDWYKQINMNDMKVNCKNMLKIIDEENREFRKALKNIREKGIKNGKNIN